MITMVEARNIQGSLLGLPIDDVSEGFALEDVDGLHPVKATIVSSGFANMDKQEYQSSRRDTRDIKLKIGLEPDYVTTTASDLRNRLYSFFMPKSPVNLAFTNSNGLIVNIDGYVESCEAPLWTEEPEMEVVVRCLDSDFVEVDETVVTGTSVSTTLESTITYAGNVDTGIVFKLMADRALSTFSVYLTPPDGTIRTLDFTISPGLVAGDVLTISTVPGDKFATLLHSGSENSVLYAISPQSSWLELQPGDNKIRVYATGAGVPFEVRYTNKYGGL